MTTSHDTTLPADADPRHVFVDAKFLQARWGKGRSAFYAYIDRIDGFPGQVVHGRWRLDHILAIEDGLAAGTVTVRPGTPAAGPSVVAEDDPELDDFLNPKAAKKDKAKAVQS